MFEKWLYIPLSEGLAQYKFNKFHDSKSTPFLLHFSTNKRAIKPWVAQLRMTVYKV